MVFVYVTYTLRCNRLILIGYLNSCYNCRIFQRLSYSSKINLLPAFNLLLVNNGFPIKQNKYIKVCITNPVYESKYIKADTQSTGRQLIHYMKVHAVDQSSPID